MKADALSKKLFMFDTGLNGALGCVLMLIPARINVVIMAENTLPPILYRIIGAGFLAFFAWQVTVIVRRTFDRKAILFAGWMALIPFTGLTIVLLFAGLPFKPIWHDILWAGDFYMLILGGLYFAAAEESRDARADSNRL